MHQPSAPALQVKEGAWQKMLKPHRNLTDKQEFTSVKWSNSARPYFSCCFFSCASRWPAAANRFTDFTVLQVYPNKNTDFRL
jgi:hypothetical protein